MERNGRRGSPAVVPRGNLILLLHLELQVQPPHMGKLLRLGLKIKNAFFLIAINDVSVDRRTFIQVLEFSTSFRYLLFKCFSVHLSEFPFSQYLDADLLLWT